MVVEHLHDVAGGKEVAVRLNQTLSTLQHFESTATLGGTLEQPELKFESSLGERLASEIAHIKNGKLSDDQLVLKNEIDQFYQTQVVPLKSNIATELDTINRSIESQIVVAKRIRTSIRAAKSQWPEVR